MTYVYVAGIDYGPRKGPALAFVVHFAEGGGTVSFLKADATPPDRGVSVHYVLEYTGRVVQMVPESRASGSINPNDLRTTDDPELFGAIPRKAVMGSWDNDPNSAVISLEIEGFAATGPNANQKVSLGLLVADVRSRNPDIRLLGHRDFQDYKACPGKLVPWAALGGHGPQEEPMPVLTGITIPPGALSGVIHIPSGATATKVGDSSVHTFPTATDAPGVEVTYAGDRHGFLITPSGNPYLIGPVPFTPTAGDCTAAVAAEHERVRSAAIAAVEAVK